MHTKLNTEPPKSKPLLKLNSCLPIQQRSLSRIKEKMLERPEIARSKQRKLSFMDKA